MKLSSPSAPILEAITKASLALSSRQSLPALTLAKVDCTESGVTITCDCLDACVRVQVDGVKRSGEGSFLCSPRLLRASLRAEEFQMEVGDGKAIVQSEGRSVMALSMERFPDPRPTMETHEVDAKALLFSIRSGLACAASGDSVWSGVTWDKDWGGIVGLDGSKMMHFCPVDLGLERSVVLPRFGANLIASLFAWDEPLSIGLLKNTLHLSQGPLMAWVQLCDMSPPSFQKYIGESARLCSVGREELMSAIDSLLPFGDPEFSKVYFEVGNSHVSLKSCHQGNESTASVECVLRAQPEKFIMLGSILAKSIKCWTSDTITISKGQVIVVKPDDSSGCLASFAPCSH